MKISAFIAPWLFIAGLYAQNPAPVIQISTSDITCAGKKDGRLELTLLAGALPVDFQWINLNTSAQGLGQFSVANQPIQLQGLSAGLYRMTFTAANGADTTLQRPIGEPLPLNGKLLFQTGSSGYALKCAGGADGRVAFEVTGGTAPLTFAWSNGDQGVQADSLPAGPLGVTVTNARGCLLVADTVLSAPPPIDATISVVGETCLGQNSGAIALHSVTGGVPPYQFTLNGAPAGQQTAWTDLPPGNYFLAISDNTGCVHTKGIVLPTGLEFTLQLGADTTLLTGDTLRLTPRIEPPADTLIWLPPQGVRTISPQEVLLFPFSSTTYQLTAVSADGCIATDDIRIVVRRDREIYLPNVFAPGAQSAENRSFTVYGSAGIRSVALLQVYDRFGRQWFENRNFPVNDLTSGWSGADGREDAPAGVYLWRAVLQYTDGRELRLMGEVTVIR